MINKLLLLDKKKIQLFWVVVVYCIVFNLVYKYYLLPFWQYFGYDYIDSSWPFILITWLLSILPVLLFSVEIKRTSDIINWFIYLFVYIPALYCLLFIKPLGNIESFKTQSTLFIGFLIILFGSNCIPIITLKPLPISRTYFDRGLLIIIFILSIYVMYFFRNTMRFVSLDDVYELRFESSDIANGGMINYAVMLLGNVLYPFLIAKGLEERKRVMIIFGIAGEIMLYTTGGAKALLISSIVLLICYFLVSRSKKHFSVIFVMAITLFIIFLLIGINLTYGTKIGEIIYIGGSLFLMRTVSISGVLTTQYQYFFSRNTFTYYSHVHGVSLFVKYPYKENSIGQVIGQYYYNTTLMNANAHFWAMDGIAAWGNFGIIVVSILCAIFFYVINSVTIKHSISFSAAAISIVCLSLCNVSLFTTFISGGGLLIICLFFLTPPVKYKLYNK